MPLHHDKGCEWSKKKNFKNEKLRISPLNLILLSQLRFLGFEMEKSVLVKVSLILPNILT